MIRKNIYKWHRICSLIIAIPVLLWALSGFMHPIMTNLRPAMTTQSIPVESVDSTKIKLSLQQVLKQNKIDSIYSTRLVHIDTNWFYQVKTSRKYNLLYISTKNGNILAKGDWLYAQYIARLFLEGASKKDKMPAMDMSMPMSDGMDCCGEAASTVLNNKTGAPIEGASLVTQFDEEYKTIYCLLPVYKVQFKRNDGIRLYVEPAQDRFAVAVDKNRAAFTKFFDLVHTWGWINFLGKGRLFVEMFFTGLGFLTALMGIYIFFATKSKKVPGNPLIKARRNHRYTAIIASLFTLMFTFSGFYHAFSKLGGEEKEMKSVIHGFAASSINLDLNKLQTIVKKPITNIGLVQFDGKTYWQVYLQSDQKSHKSKDLMKTMSADAALVTYINAADFSVLKNGDEQYAKSLATQLSNTDPNKIVSAELTTKFTDEYNFTDKRLPVWKIDYPFNHKQRLYIETSTGVLAKNTNDAELYEGYSFALFHKHHYMDFAGKTIRDISTMIGAALQIMMIIIGLIFYFKWRKRKMKIT
ncbi:PepSY domain-containing protein [Pedobacter sp. L105]|uniref:PepSY domain-containing protein n=1 Tax=Pedobacter sp. L105 TaxID=1641871 RepID=UPI00131B9BA8|nr:PepSY domain-containing protein [Pedobacter sp. L105]